jgi:hypothetical protein
MSGEESLILDLPDVLCLSHSQAARTECLKVLSTESRFDRFTGPVIPMTIPPRNNRIVMADTTALYALRFPDGSLSLFIDEAYAQDRGIDPLRLVRVEIPREMFITGTIQDIREYVAIQLEQRQQTGTA